MTPSHRQDVCDEWHVNLLKKEMRKREREREQSLAWPRLLWKPSICGVDWWLVLFESWLTSSLSQAWDGTAWHGKVVKILALRVLMIGDVHTWEVHTWGGGGAGLVRIPILCEKIYNMWNFEILKIYNTLNARCHTTVISAFNLVECAAHYWGIFFFN